MGESDILEEVERLQGEFIERLQAASTSQEVEQLRVAFLGKKGAVAPLLQALRTADPARRRELGLRVNDLKEEIERQLKKRGEELFAAEEAVRLASEEIDVTLPGRSPPLGGRHVVSAVLQRMLSILREEGFTVYSAPEVETDEYNFSSLNFPEDHPARDMQDTFYLPGGSLLRTHTTNAQLRVMQTTEPPIRIVSTGRAFRNEVVTARSHVFFHQLDALYIAQGVTFGDLLATMRGFLSRLFTEGRGSRSGYTLGEEQVKLRFRPSYFPFVEPGVEVDVFCSSCSGQGCALCKGSGWLEVAGAGMVHPNVLRNGSLDPMVHSGFAWGIGVERVAMLLYGIDDIRHFTTNDLRFLRQFVAL